MRVPPGATCPDCGASLHGYPCIHHEKDCEVVRNHKVIAAYEYVHACLRPSMSDKGLIQWWNSKNRYLGRSPHEAMKRGELVAVMEAADSFADGDYL